ncbi:MAG: hypothetical protein M3332_03075, partial [Actinomycetota bacterium]|nr:hypothetical protein [Actinomycetota bacterium]
MCCRGEVSGGSDRITHGTLRDRVALDQRLRDAAGPSLRHSRTRLHAAREQVRAELLAAAAGALPATHLDDFGA